MKKIVVFCVAFMCLGLSNLLAQYDLSLLHSPSGKKWVQFHHPDDNQSTQAERDVSFTFFSDGTVQVSNGTSPSPSFSGENTSKRNAWTTSGPVLHWTATVNGEVKTYRAEIQVLTAGRMVLSLTEPGHDVSRSVLLTPQ
jgi:hypothetical protein